jgi:RNA polymerase sigma factor (sigma-70 family)
MSSDTETLYTLWQSVEKLIRMWARRYMKTTETRLYDIDDLMQAGFLAVYDAAHSHDPGKGAFSTYLKYHIRRRFAEVAGHRGTKRRPELYATSLDEPLTDDYDATRLDAITDPEAVDGFENVIERVYTNQLSKTLDDCLATLTPEQAETLRALYYRELTRKEAAVEQDADVDTIRRTEYKALQKMRWGKNFTRLKEYKDFIISRQYRYGGYKAFTETGYSSVEWAAEKIIDGFDALEVSN